MDNVLVQSAVIPLVVGLVAALALRPTGAPWAGLGFTLAFGSAAYLIAGFQLLPLTSTRKILAAAALAVLVAVVLEARVRDRRIRLWLPTAAAAAAALWVIWPVILRSEGAEAAWVALPALAYAAWLTAGVELLASRPVKAAVAALMLAVGTGVSALLGASALMGQLGGAVAAAVGAYVMVFLWRGEFAPGRTLALPATLLCALIGVAAVHYASLPWYSLAPLALIPLLARLPLPAGRSRFSAILLASIYMLPGAAAAILITWRVAGPPPL
jgi:hypothetical protein